MNKYVSLKNPYTYDGSDVLVNKFDIRDARKLEEMKRDMSSNRAFELWATPIQGDFDLKHLQAIHKKLFSDVYPFAGEIRTIDISKGNSRFAHAPMIEGYLSGEFRKLKSQNYLQGTTIDQFSEKAANVMGGINAAHPFREGNV